MADEKILLDLEGYSILALTVLCAFALIGMLLGYMTYNGAQVLKLVGCEKKLNECVSYVNNYMTVPEYEVTWEDGFSATNETEH